VDVDVTRPVRIPDRGDIAPALVAQRLGMSPADFDARRGELERRGFPEPDPTTGKYCIEAVDRWRLRRFPRLFPELTASHAAVDARTVIDDRLRAMEGAGRG
jgi:hypothetical protein